jgi:hypothetical protein
LFTLFDQKNFLMLKNKPLLLILFTCLACRQTPTPPSRVLSEEQFQSLYVALLEAGERQRITPQDSTKRFKADSLFQAFNTSEFEFRSKVASRARDGKDWQKFYEAVTKRLDENQKKLNEKSRP